MHAASLLDSFRAAGFEVLTTAEVAAREGFGHLSHPHQCRGCGRWVEGRGLDEHEKECARPDVLRAYRSRKSELAKRSAHRRHHQRRGVIKDNCQWCTRSTAG